MMRCLKILASTFLLTAVFGAVVGTQESVDGWRLATPDYVLEFPRDHAAHSDYRIEWWYYTGNVETVEGRRFGYQLTFFRVGINPSPINPSQWTVRDLHMAHFAITDVERGTHRVSERLNRSGVGWAGASTDTLQVWNEEWRASMTGTTHRLQAIDTTEHGELSLDLRLDSGDAVPVRHGVNGFSQKGRQIGNASHYYSFTRLETVGQLVVDGESFDVSGFSWMDHEFGSSFLEESQIGWDWFSIQLDDGTDVMVYTIRSIDGEPGRLSSGTVVTTESVTILDSSDYQLAPVRRWTSPRTGAAYPVVWKLELPNEGLSLDVAAVVEAQELVTAESTGVTYWEGTVEVSGTRNGEDIAGRGYLEMTGYAGPPMSTVLR